MTDGVTYHISVLTLKFQHKKAIRIMRREVNISILKAQRELLRLWFWINIDWCTLLGLQTGCIDNTCNYVLFKKEDVLSQMEISE